ncbi:MAG: hypothetical protein A2365_03115 [Candidatus Nealsonbacteria bacterium RIFOXYB1_FULL_40_15]|uniref:GIY-YIG domain-containing protein n=2 Tax=Candidatus Nealsoniibacteriota TaxID=1817911 RepID=A0A1G2EU33_9BACT|nr:MAG: hypothetical protein A2365_03115 [Candidatus Nealsonbacteria bacterium RIFOXYB1_FULL_40_15]OGZ29217.1 MAG: hypothetical protein A2427_02975 [Candidatus Nealsonbacteria bacterium RIFOXYC1_FULL_40_7]OGZ29902.1 MAG: hypothetical protein A2562_02150 [Candidatus Nealsonbacteria bacterium RIFOXYD1_FULL_39_11]
MFFVYILKSLKNGKRYIGCTGKEPEIRIIEHNSGCNKWTRVNKPFKLIYKELYNSKTEALKRENFLKSGQGRKFIDQHIPR